MEWDAWRRDEPLRLAQYVTASAAANIDLGIDRLAVETERGGRRKIAQAVYEQLRRRGIRYTNEGYDPSGALQKIRTPVEVIFGREATCLDLVLLFCGACLRFELLPFVVVVEGHALAAISQTHGLREWNAAMRPGRSLFERPLTDVAQLVSLIDDRRALLPIECTGFAASDLLPMAPNARYPETVGRQDGTMSFDRAVAAGREQVGGARAFQYAVDVAVARYASRIEPLATQFLPPEKIDVPGLRFQYWCPADLRPSGEDPATADPLPQDARILAASGDIARLQELGTEFVRQGRWRAALITYGKLRRAAFQASNPRLAMDAREQMGRIYWKMGDKARACECWRTCWEACEGDPGRLQFEERLRAFIDG